MTYPPGDILLGKYRIEEMIGRGAFAEVYRATHIELNRPRALKILRKDTPGVGSSTFQDYEQRFGLEAKLGDRLDHPNLIQVYDFDREGNDLVLVMEYAPGGNLAEKIQAARDHGEFIPIEEIKKTAIDIAQGLAEIHKLDIVHRDLKPSNIVFDKEGRSKIADLGLAQTPESRIVRQLAGSVGFDQPGTMEYMPPEQCPGQKMPVKASADIYALGCITFEMLTGRVYYQQRSGTKPSSLRPDVPPWIGNLVMRMLSNNPESRSWDGSEAVELLNNGASSSFDLLFRFLKKLRYWWIILGLAILGLLVFMINNYLEAASVPKTSTPTLTEVVRTPPYTILPPTPTDTASVIPTVTKSPTSTSSKTPSSIYTLAPSITFTPTSTITLTPSITNTPTPTYTNTQMVERIYVTVTNVCEINGYADISFTGPQTFYAGGKIRNGGSLSLSFPIPGTFYVTARIWYGQSYTWEGNIDLTSDRDFVISCIPPILR